MPLTYIAVLVVVAATILWISLTQRNLMKMEEHTRDALSQIGSQLALGFDTLTTLKDLAGNYTQNGSIALIEAILSGQAVITPKSTPNEVLFQEWIIVESLARIAMVADQYPELKANQTFITAMERVQDIQQKMRISHLHYNDCVRILNREIRTFPKSIISGILGFRQREYLVEWAGMRLALSVI